MQPQVTLLDKAFCLEFHTTGNLADSAAGSWLQDRIGTDGFVVQERIIVPQPLVDRSNILSGHAIAPNRCNKPLILVGGSELQTQRALVVVKPTSTGTCLRKHDGSITVDADGIHLFFGAPILSPDSSTRRGLTSSFDDLRSQLHAHNMQASDIARIWLFMDDILSGYPDLNFARAQFFDDWFDPRRHLIPASTGIEGHHIERTPLSLECWASSGNRINIQREPSPLQNEPVEYDKLFSRALSVQFADQKALFVSGTASIDRNGVSIHIGDFDQQLAFTLEVIAAILKQAGGNFANVAQAIVYLKRSEDLPNCLDLLDAAAFPRERTLFQLDTNICREELLCEIEVTAVI
jgi:enamine deaminase RidA (YjgF/YER057c/UK114 family)